MPRLQTVYEKRGNLFFLSSKEAAQARVQGKCHVHGAAACSTYGAWVVQVRQPVLTLLVPANAIAFHLAGQQQEALASLQDLGGKGADRQSLNF